MAFGRKKKDEGDPGERLAPFMSNEVTLDSYGIYPARGRSAKSAKWQARIVMFFFVSLVMVVVIGAVSSIFSGGKMSALKDQVEINKSPAFKSRYDSLGASIVTSYFAGDTPPVNLLAQSNWPNMNSNSGEQEGGGNYSAASDGSKTGPGGGQPVKVENLSLIQAYETPFEASATGTSDKQDLSTFTNPVNEILRYSGTIDGRQYEFGVYLVIPDIEDNSKLPYLVSPPTIMPMRTLVSADVEGSRPNDPKTFEEVELNSGTLDVINKWAGAYAQGDSAAIKSYTGDGRVEATYQGVGGFTLNGTPTVEWSYQYQDPETKENRIVARISFTMSSEVGRNSVSDSVKNDLSEGSSSSDSNFTPVQVMDVLLGNFDEGVADIMAWGPGGMWQTLTPRMNSVVPVIQDGEQEVTSNTETPESEGEESSESTDESGSEESSTGVPGAPTLTEGSSTSSSESSKSSEKTSSTKKKNKKKSNKTKTRSRGESHRGGRSGD